MTLKEYLAQEGMTATRLAQETGTTVSTITRLAKGELTPSHKLMEAIYRATGGAVAPNDFFEIEL